jgi:hypothetical protein
VHFVVIGFIFHKVLWKEGYILLKFIDLFDLSSLREIGYKLFYGIGLSLKVRFRWVKCQLTSEHTNYEHLLVAVLLSRFPKNRSNQTKQYLYFGPITQMLVITIHQTYNFCWIAQAIIKCEGPIINDGTFQKAEVSSMFNYWFFLTLDCEGNQTVVEHLMSLK